MGAPSHRDEDDLSSFFIKVIHFVIVGFLLVVVAVAATCSDARGRLQWHLFCYRVKAYLRGSSAGPAYVSVGVSDASETAGSRNVPRCSSSSSSSSSGRSSKKSSASGASAKQSAPRVGGGRARRVAESNTEEESDEEEEETPRRKPTAVRGASKPTRPGAPRATSARRHATLSTSDDDSEDSDEN